MNDTNAMGNNNPFNEGFAVDRMVDHCNPYLPGSINWNLWEDGYEQAMENELDGWMDEKELEEWDKEISDALDVLDNEEQNNGEW